MCSASPPDAHARLSPGAKTSIVPRTDLSALIEAQRHVFLLLTIPFAATAPSQPPPLTAVRGRPKEPATTEVAAPPEKG